MKIQEIYVKLKSFIEESIVELKKVTWPPRKETIKASYAVIIFMIILGIFLGIVDFVLAKLVNWMVG
ncbi:MAG: preprotein translocase subunit SecE [Proteobacteria bacterium]|nr:preprotein translocase subunit SecE [Pseudomonadota bacterium]